MDIERRILQFVVTYQSRHGTYPTIAKIAARLSFRKAKDKRVEARDVADIILGSNVLDYTVPVRGEKSKRDDVCNWTIEPVDLQSAYQELGK